jgi:hypothetical protein
MRKPAQDESGWNRDVMNLQRILRRVKESQDTFEQPVQEKLRELLNDAIVILNGL